MLNSKSHLVTTLFDMPFDFLSCLFKQFIITIYYRKFLKQKPVKLSTHVIFSKPNYVFFVLIPKIIVQNLKILPNIYFNNIHE